MGFRDELGRRFTGFWNYAVMVALIGLCLHFAALKWDKEPFDVQLILAGRLALFILAIALVGAVLATVMAKKPTIGELDRGAALVRGFRNGLTFGGFVVLLVGLAMVPGFLFGAGDIVKELIKKAVEKYT